MSKKQNVDEISRSNFSALKQSIIRLDEMIEKLNKITHSISKIIKGSWITLSINILILSINVYIVFVTPKSRDIEVGILKNQHLQMLHISTKMDSVSNHLRHISESLIDSTKTVSYN